MPAQAHADFIRRTSLDAMVHWEGEAVQLMVDPALERRFGPEVRAALTEAAEAWDLGGDVPRVELIHDVTERELAAADEETTNRIGFAEHWTYGDKLAVTVSTYDARTGVLVAAQVWINPDRKFALMSPEQPDMQADSYDLQAVLTHELGHVLGLGEAEGLPGTTMFPTFHHGETRQRTLSLTDEREVDTLYTETHADVESSACSVAAPHARPGLGLPLAVFGLFVASVTRRRRKLTS